MSLAHDTAPRTLPLPLRHDWTVAEVRALFDLPFPELMFRAAETHRAHFDPAEVQISISVPTSTTCRVGTPKKAPVRSPLRIMKANRAPVGASACAIIEGSRATFFSGQYWITFFPSLAIVSALLGFHLLGDGLNARRAHREGR